MTDFQGAAGRRERIRIKLRIGLVVAGLVIGTAAIYQQALGFEFINTDDQTYVSENLRVQRGLTATNVVWAFTSMSVANWHPLTWLSHMLDVELHGLDAGGHHLTNVALHMANALVLFGLLCSLTGALWRSAVVAALFAVHPLHVESVAWVSERKDVLCAFFWFLAIWSYGAQVRRSAGKRPNLALPWALSAAALLAKPMAVTLPFVLLLLDYWPLNRLDRANLRSRVDEKLAFFALALGSVVMTLTAQRGGGAMQDSLSVGVGLRLANAAVSYATYLLKCVWPSDLAILRPHPYIPGTGGEPWEVWQIAGAVVLLVAVSGFVALARRRYLTMGWLWYLGTLVPVIGIVQVGTQAYADRYTYVPLIGIFVMAVWGLAEASARLRERTAAFNGIAAVGLVAMLLALGWVCWQQASHWRASIPLYEQALRVVPDNTVVHLALASSLLSADRGSEAMPHARRALELKPDYGEAHDTIGRVHKQSGRHEQALARMQQAVHLSPHSSYLRSNLGNQLLLLNQVEAAIEQYERACELDSERAQPHLALAAVLRHLGRPEEAIGRYGLALDIEPELLEGRLELARTLSQLGRTEQAISQYERILSEDPTHAKAQYGLERAREAR